MKASFIFLLTLISTQSLAEVHVYPSKVVNGVPKSFMSLDLARDKKYTVHEGIPKSVKESKEYEFYRSCNIKQNTTSDTETTLKEAVEQTIEASQEISSSTKCPGGCPENSLETKNDNQLSEARALCALFRNFEGTIELEGVDMHDLGKALQFFTNYEVRKLYGSTFQATLPTGDKSLSFTFDKFADFATSTIKAAKLFQASQIEQAPVDTTALAGRLKNISQAGYQARQRLLHAAARAEDFPLDSAQAYVKSPIPEGSKAAADQFLMKPEHWIESRRKLHDQLLKKKEDQIERYSKIISKISKADPNFRGKPVLILMRGNSGSGKTYTTQLAPQGTVLGKLGRHILTHNPSVNPDDFKEVLQNKEEKGQVSNSAVHREGSALAKRVIENAFTKKRSFVIDKRFDDPESIRSVVQEAKASGYFISIVDIDVPIEISARRVAFGRKPGNITVPFAPLSAGFEGIRKNRTLVANLSDADEYVLFDNAGKQSITSIPVAVRSSETQGKLRLYSPKKWKTLNEASEGDIDESRSSFGALMELQSKIIPADYNALK